MRHGPGCPRTHHVDQGGLSNASLLKKERSPSSMPLRSGLIASLGKKCGIRQNRKQRAWETGISAAEQGGLSAEENEE